MDKKRPSQNILDFVIENYGTLNRGGLERFLDDKNSLLDFREEPINKTITMPKSLTSEALGIPIASCGDNVPLPFYTYPALYFGATELIYDGSLAAEGAASVEVIAPLDALNYPPAILVVDLAGNKIKRNNLYEGFAAGFIIKNAAGEPIIRVEACEGKAYNNNTRVYNVYANPTAPKHFTITNTSPNQAWRTGVARASDPYLRGWSETTFLSDNLFNYGSCDTAIPDIAGYTNVFEGTAAFIATDYGRDGTRCLAVSSPTGSNQKKYIEFGDLQAAPEPRLIVGKRLLFSLLVYEVLAQETSSSIRLSGTQSFYQNSLALEPLATWYEREYLTPAVAEGFSSLIVAIYNEPQWLAAGYKLLLDDLSLRVVDYFVPNRVRMPYNQLYSGLDADGKTLTHPR